MRGDRLREMGSKRLASIAVVLGLLVVSAFVLYFVYAGASGREAKVTTSSSQQEIGTQVAKFIDTLNARNNSGLLTFYTNSSIVRWYGNSGFQDGTYEGASDGIKLLYKVFTSDMSSIHGTVSNLTTSVIASGTVNATFGLYLKEDGPITGPRNATAIVHQLWVNSGGIWYIQRETWHYLTLTGTPIA